MYRMLNRNFLTNSLPRYKGTIAHLCYTHLNKVVSTTPFLRFVLLNAAHGQFLPLLLDLVPVQVLHHQHRLLLDIVLLLALLRPDNRAPLVK